MEISSGNKLIQLWISLSPAEIRGMNMLVHSIFFNRREDLSSLYAYLRKKEFPGCLPLERKDVHDAIFPERPYDDVRLRGTMSDLQERIERYLLLSHHESDTLNYQLAKVRLYRSRGLFKHYEFAQRKLDKMLEKQPERNADYYELAHGSAIEKLAHTSSNRRSRDLDLQPVADGIDRLFLIKKLRHACTQLTHQAIHPIDYDFGLLKLIIEQIPNLLHYRIPAVALYYHCFCFLSDSESSHHFQQFKSLFTTNAQKFSQAERKDLYLFALNYCIRRHNRGEANYTVEAWNLYRFALEQKLLLENGLMSRFTFSNIVGIAIKVGKLKWADQFIKDNHQLVDIKYRASNLNLNMARLAFARREFSDALPMLQQVDRSDQLNNLICRSLLIKIFFETNAIDSLYAQLDGLDQFLRRRDASEFHRKNYGNFTKFIRQYLALSDYENDKKMNLKKEILLAEGLSEKEWLLSLISQG
ncbi:MAG: hypothetical protein AAF741_10530 [Bacteroidota bacterium]